MSHSDFSIIRLEHYSAAVLDMDGVITQTMRPHFHAWKRMFDDYLRSRNVDFEPFTEEDYYNDVDGKPRYQGARSFLESRGIDLNQGRPDDSPGTETVCGLGNRKNHYFLDYLKENGADLMNPRLNLSKNSNRGKSVAAISSSRNARAVLRQPASLICSTRSSTGWTPVNNHLRANPNRIFFSRPPGVSM
ncbi:MAG: hypothetical protein U5R06_00445 [candidate division KSB1 bacterium]|nr:hypothetical protein [candidate division KSB1 bacterium]